MIGVYLYRFLLTAELIVIFVVYLYVRCGRSVLPLHLAFEGEKVANAACVPFAEEM